MNRKSLLLLSIGIFTVLTATSADVRQRLTFDLDWKFKLCRDSSDVIQTLRTLGISDNPLSATRHNAVTTKVTDDTEPEQAQVTASEIPISDKAHSATFKSPTIGVPNCHSSLKWAVLPAILPADKEYT